MVEFANLDTKVKKFKVNCPLAKKKKVIYCPHIIYEKVRKLWLRGSGREPKVK